MMEKRIRIEPRGGLELLWFASWLFIIGYLNMGFWKAVLGLVVWPCFLGVGISAVNDAGSGSELRHANAALKSGMHGHVKMPVSEV